MDLRQEQQLLSNLQESVDSWKDFINQKLKENIDLQNPSHQSITLQQVIIFTLSKLDFLLKKHKELALAALDRDSAKTISNDGAYKNLFKLIRLSHQTFQNIEEIQKTYTKDSEKYHKTAQIALKAIITILAMLVLSALALYIASTLTTLATMPIVYSFVAGAGAMLISIAIGSFSDSHAFYLKNKKAPKDLRPSSLEFYNEQLLVNTTKLEDNKKTGLKESYVNLCLTNDRLVLNEIQQDTFTGQNFNMTDMEINDHRDTNGQKDIDNILPEPTAEGVINYFTLFSEENPQLKRIIYRVKNDKIRYIFTKNTLNNDQKVIDSILQNATNMHSYDCQQRFFNNAIKKMLVDPSSSNDTSNQEVQGFLSTIGIYQ